MTSRGWLRLAGLFGALGVALGAYAAHGLEDRLVSLGFAADEVARRLAIFQTGTRYQLAHAPVLLFGALLVQRHSSRIVQLGLTAIAAGTGIFSGLLYVLTFVGPDWRWLGAIVPVGGVLMIVGWLAMTRWRV